MQRKTILCKQPMSLKIDNSNGEAVKGFRRRSLLWEEMPEETPE